MKEQCIIQFLRAIPTERSAISISAQAIAQSVLPAQLVEQLDIAHAHTVDPATNADPSGFVVSSQRCTDDPADLVRIKVVFLENYCDSNSAPFYTAPFESSVSSLGGQELPLQLTSTSSRVPLIEAFLQPVIDALVNSGVLRSAIAVVTILGGASSYHYTESAALSFELSNPTQADVQQIIFNVSAGVADRRDYPLNISLVQYPIRDDQALEAVAYIAAMQMPISGQPP